MSVSFMANAAALLVVVLFLGLLTGSLLWRIGLWFIPPVEQLHTVEGLPIGSDALEIAAAAGPDEYHLTFRNGWTFLVFGSKSCEPCQSLLRVATEHPATRAIRLVYVGDTDEIEIDCAQHHLWEVYRFHDEELSRRQWRAPVSPYFHVIDPRGRVVAKGTASKLVHLDRLLSLAPVLARQGVMDGR